MGYDVMLKDKPERHDSQNGDETADIEPVESSTSATEYEYEHWNYYHQNQIWGVQDIVEETVVSWRQVGD